MSAQVQTVQALIARQSSRQPTAIYAVDSEGRQALSYGELQLRCARIAAWLGSAGSQPGDTVSLVMPNGLMSLQLLLGAMAHGWCVNPVNLLSQPEQMRYVLDHSDCKVVIVNAEWESRVRAILGQIARPIRMLVIEADASDLPVATGVDPLHDTQQSPTRAVRPDSRGLLMYTSGTTGVPKGVMLSQSNLVANALAISAEHQLGEGDRVLAVLPLYHINAFAVTMLAPLAEGGSLVMPPKFSAASFWDQAIRGACTWINVVPTMISYLLEGPAPDRSRTSGIRFCRSASSALPPEHLRAFEDRFGIGVIETMGLTETVAPAFSNPLDPSRRKLGSVGVASGGEAAVVDASLQRVADGCTGEVIIHGPHVMQGYYKNPEATRAAFTPDGWLRTGDLGHRDSDGFFFITGRIKELIIKGGENIAPREIDEALLAHPAVLEAAAVGIPDKHYGQDILACIVLRPEHPCTETDLRIFCEQHLGRYKTPKVFRFVTELPRGPSGKVQRLKLLEGLQAA